MGQSRFQKQNAKDLETIAQTEHDAHACFVWSEGGASLFLDVERTRSRTMANSRTPNEERASGI